MQKSGKYSILNSIIQLLRLPPSHVVLQLRAMSSSKGWMHFLTKWNASWECWKLKSMYCRTDKAPSLTMGYSSLEKTWWGEKSKWAGRMASKHACKGPSGNAGHGNLLHLLVCSYTYLDVKAHSLKLGLQRHLLSSDVWPWSTIKTPCELSSLFQTCTVRHRALGYCNITPLCLIEEALQEQRAATFSIMSFFCLLLYLKSYHQPSKAKG